ncbi:MAG TPA: TRAP transporter substrate-binding protein DctP [Hyphomicrobiaceae bacterium]|jgi:TRAP-type C4-dicarboxylate transport system substrate-binding protein|nr:TRAP transporter substrate-binding protein DctP [Hyphomicrobiaceae bacterium]
MRIVCAILALLFLASFDPVAARELKISHQWPAEADARDRAARIFVKEVLARAPGISFQIYPQLALKMKAEEQFAALQSGAVDLSVYPLPYAVKQVPEFSLAVLPCLYPSLDVVRGIKGTQVAHRLQDIANARGVHILGWWWVPGGFVTRDREIAGPNSVKGLRLRGGDPMFDLMLKEAGATPVELTSNEIYAAMKAGTLDGALTSYETFVSTKIYEQGRYFTAGSPGIWMFATPLLISKSVWDSLSEIEQEAFEAAAAISEEYFAATQLAAEARFIETFKKAGAKYHKFTHDEYLAWLQLAQRTAWKEYIKISPATGGMLREVVQTILLNSKSR